MTSNALSIRRLSDSESDIWIKLGRDSDSGDNAIFTRKFMSLENSMVFVSFDGNRPIGGTALYRERIRPGLVMLNTRIESTWREQSSKIIESSLQLSCDSSISDVDVLIAPDDRSSPFYAPLYFPLRFELDEWIRPALEINNFEKVDSMFQEEYFFSSFEDLDSELDFDDEVVFDDVVDLFWKSDMICSHFWYLMDLHKEIGTIKTTTIDGKIASCMGVSKISGRPVDYAIVTILLNDEITDLESVVKLNMSKIDRLGTKRVVIPLNSYRQMRKLDDIIELIAGYNCDRRELMLFRKKL